MPYAAEPVKVEDVPGLALAMMNAFIRDPHWALLRPNMTLEEIIDGYIQRLPKNLTTGREKKRHQKVVETETGEIVGYARWIIPRDAGIEWLGSQVIEPTEVQAQDYEKRWMDDPRVRPQWWQR
jgi:hypothetical protein